MSENSKRTFIILLIMLASILLGVAVDMVWGWIEKKMHPIAYHEIIAKASEEFDVPEAIIYATIKVESGFDPEAISSKGAQGLMQMLPSTFEWLTGDEHLGENIPSRRLDDPEVNIRYGTYYLSYLYRKFDYNWDTAIAAYNGGETNVRKWLNSMEYSDGKGNLTQIPFPETEKYVKKVKDAIAYYENQALQGEEQHAESET